MIASRRTAALLLVAGLGLPLAATGALAWSFGDRENTIDQIPVAIVNEDEIVTGDSPMAAGRALSAALIEPDDGDEVLAWRLTTAEAAQTGLEDGTFSSVLTIPADFSASVISTGGDDPRAATVTLESDNANSPTAALVSRTVAEAAAETLGDQITAAYLTSVYDGFNTIGESFESAADGAQSLASGADGVDSGAASVADGAVQLTVSLSALADGASQVADGAGTVSSSAVSLADGSAALADGASDLASGADGLSASAGTLDESADTLASSLAQLSASCALVSASPQFCAQLAAAASGSASLGDGTSALVEGTDTLDASAAALAASAGTVASGAAALSDGASGVATASGSLATGAAEAATGAASVSDGAAELSEGAGSLARSSHDLSDGLSSGAASVPSYTDDESTTLSDLLVEPVAVTPSSRGDADGWPPSLIAGIVLALGSLVTVLAVGPGSADRDRLSTVSLRRRVGGLLVVRLGIALAQSAVVTMVLAVAGVAPDSIGVFAALTALASCVFMLVASAVQVLCGRAGVLVNAAFLVIQVASIGGIVPVETAPPVVQFLNAFLPLPVFLDGTAQAVGGDIASVGSTVAILLAWALVSVAGLAQSFRSRGFIRHAELRRVLPA